MIHGIRIKVLLTALAFSNQFMMPSLQQGCPDSPSPDSGNFTAVSIQCGVLKITRPKGECPHPLDVTIEIMSVENYTANQSLNPLVTIWYEDQKEQLYSEHLTDSKFNGIFTLKIYTMTSDMGLNATLSVKHGDGDSFDVKFEIGPSSYFVSGANAFGPFRIDDSNLTFQSVCFINTGTMKETIVTMVTTNFTNCTNQSLASFSLPLILELSNGSQYDLQNRNRTCNRTMPWNNAPMALNVSEHPIASTCLDSTTVETKLTLPNFSEAFTIHAKLSESTARRDVCRSIMANEYDEHCKATGTTTANTTVAPGIIAAIIVVVAVVVAVSIIIIIVAVAIVCFYKRRQPRNRSTPARSRRDSQELQPQPQTAENTNSDQVTGTEHSEAARHEGIRSTTADHQRSGTSN